MLAVDPRTHGTLGTLITIELCSQPSQSKYCFPIGYHGTVESAEEILLWNGSSQPGGRISNVYTMIHKTNKMTVMT